MVVNKEPKGKLELNLTGPQGNAFCVMGNAQKLCRELGFTKEKTDSIIEDMKSGDYEHLIDVMEENFGDYIIMYR